MHESLNIKDWQSFYEKYTSAYVEGMRGRFLLRKEREEDLKAFCNSLSRAYKKAQAQEDKWNKSVWLPLCGSIESLSVDDKVILHAKPTHNYKKCDDRTWWEYTYDYSSNYGWGYSFDWIDEPEVKINHDLGQRLYEIDRYNNKFTKRLCVLKSLLQQYLIKLLYQTYGRECLAKYSMDNKLVKIRVHGDEYWFCVTYNGHGIPVWDNFIWQNNNCEEINLEVLK
jgi:hypothetical protein